MNQKSKSVFIVNDSVTTLRYYSDVLESEGLKVSSFQSAEAAIHAMDLSHPPDLIITDLYMPGIDGWRFCRLLRSPEYKVCNTVPILVISATYSGDDAKRITSGLGANAFLSLPVDLPVLLQNVYSLLEEGIFQNLASVLIIEDSKFFSNMLHSAFKERNYTPYTAFCGNDGEQVFKTVKPDIVILDHHLPDMYGEDLLQNLKQFHPPSVFIMITGDSNPKLALEWMKKGASAYALKPFEPDYVIALCENACRERALLRVEELLEKRTLELNEHRNTLQALINSNRESLLLVDAETLKILAANEMAAQKVGKPLDELIGSNKLALFPNNIAHNIKQHAEECARIGDSVSFEDQRFGRYYENYVYPVQNDKGNVTKLSFLSVDITNRKTLEEQLIKSQKLESIGVLAGGIAHDFNNLLMAIGGNTSLAKSRVNPEDKIYGFLSKVEESVDRAQDLTQQLLTFSRGGKPVKNIMSMKDVVKKACLFASAGTNVKCEFDFQENLRPVEIDERQIRQVIYNLIGNAIQSMPDGGPITITLENYFPKETADNASLFHQTEYVKLQVIDQGCGIPEDHMDKIFDPYFTTKDTVTQKGLGLGLSICHTIIEKHKGLIQVKSEEGLGTTFTIYFPAYFPRTKEENLNRETISLVDRKILLLEDNDMARDIACKMLKKLGCDVVCVDQGSEAIKIYNKSIDSKDLFDLVLLDLTIPGDMGGKETMMKLQEINPEIKAIVSSGHTDDPILANYKDHGFSGVLCKPYRVDQLKNVLEEVLSCQARELVEVN